LFLVCFVHINLFCVNMLFIFTKSGLMQHCDICWYFFSNCMQKYIVSIVILGRFVLCYLWLNIYIKHVFIVFQTVAINVYHHLVPFVLSLMISRCFFLLQNIGWVNIKFVIHVFRNLLEYVWWRIFPFNKSECRSWASSG
jgi:hypothetical protein